MHRPLAPPRLIFVFSLEMGFHHVGPAGLKLLTLSDVPALASQSAGITGVNHHVWLILVILVEMGFQYIGQAGLELLTLGDLPTSASQSAGITGMSHRTWPPPTSFFETKSRLGWNTVAWSRLTATPAYYVQVIFVFLVETGFHQVDQDGLDLLTS